MGEEEALDDICEGLKLESWHQDGMLTILLPSEGDAPPRLAKLRLVGIADKPSAADLKGEPE